MAGHIGARLHGSQRTLGWRNQFVSHDGELQRSVGIGPVIALQNVVQSKNGAIIGANCETHRVRAVIRGKPSAMAAGVTKIAEGVEQRIVGAHGLIRHGAADARP